MAKKPTSTSKRNLAYRNPPEHTRFRKGQSGNPRGRPKGSRNFRTLVEEELEQELEVAENGQTIRPSKRRLIARVLVNEAVKANARAWRELLPMIGGSSGDETVELDQMSAAMIASYLARYHREPIGNDDSGTQEADSGVQDSDSEEGNA